MRFRLRTARHILAPLAAMALILAACGGDDAPDEPDDAAEPEAEAEDESEADPEPEADDEPEPSDADTELTEPVSLALGSLDQGTAWYNYGVLMAQGMQQDFPDGSTIEVLPYSGSVGNPTLLQEGEAQIAFTFSAPARWALDGTAGTPFEGEPISELRTLVGGLDQYYMGPIVPADVPFDSLADIREGELAIDVMSQPRGSLGQVFTSALLAQYGISLEDDIPAWGGSYEATSTDVVTNAIREGRADLWIQAITAGHPNITELSQTSDIRILELDEEIIANLSDLGIGAATLPGGSFRGQDDDVRLVGFETGLYTTEDLPFEVAYNITRWILENREELADGAAGLAHLDPDRAGTDEATGGVPLHPGAEQAFRDMGLLD